MFFPKSFFGQCHTFCPNSTPLYFFYPILTFWEYFWAKTQFRLKTRMLGISNRHFVHTGSISPINRAFQKGYRSLFLTLFTSGVFRSSFVFNKSRQTFSGRQVGFRFARMSPNKSRCENAICVCGRVLVIGRPPVTPMNSGLRRQRERNANPKSCVSVTQALFAFFPKIVYPLRFSFPAGAKYSFSTIPVSTSGPS